MPSRPSSLYCDPPTRSGLSGAPVGPWGQQDTALGPWALSEMSAGHTGMSVPALGLKEADAGRPALPPSRLALNAALPRVERTLLPRASIYLQARTPPLLVGPTCSFHILKSLLPAAAPPHPTLTAGVRVASHGTRSEGILARQQLSPRTKTLDAMLAAVADLGCLYVKGPSQVLRSLSFLSRH